MSLFRDMGDANGGLLERQTVTLFAVMQRLFKSLAALENFLHVDIGAGAARDGIGEE